MITQWLILLLFGLLFLLVAPIARTAEGFFSAQTDDRQPGFWVLTSSLVISWIFAKSITNAANLGRDFGVVGGLAYAAYYGSFLVAGWVIYRMRTKGGFQSIHDFLATRHGHSAVILFSVLIAFRLFNEVWSNTMVIGSYFGEAGSSGYYWAILVFTGLTLAYTLKGGLRSSLLTDAIQMVLFGVLLFVILGLILPKAPGGLKAVMTSGEWKLSAGLNLFWVALIQVFSYPFHDSVMTDRGFISDPETIRKSFFWAGIIGALAIFLFSFVGVFAQLEGLSGQAPVAVSQYLGVGLMLIMNFIMITSAASTLDSAFSSFAKLAVLDLKLGSDRKVWTGRLVMILVCIAGTLPIFFNPEILSATTVSGTMVMGLAPVFLFWFFPSGRFSFLWSVGGGIVFGVLLTLGLWPESLTFFPGKYGDLLSVNLIGTLCCFGLFFLPHVFSNGTK